MTLKEKVLNGYELSEDEVYLLCSNNIPSGFEHITGDLVSYGRWYVRKRIIFKEKTTNKLFRLIKIESLDRGMRSLYQEQMAVEVEPYEETVINYRAVDGGH